MNIVITGANRGIGKAIAAAFAAEGHQLFLTARTELLLNETAEVFRKEYPRSVIHTYAADLTDKQQVFNFADWCLQYGPTDILVNNAGTYLPGNVMDEAEGVLEQMMATNLYSAYHLTRRLLPAMINKRSGQVFNICSIASLDAYPGGGGYSISKFALQGFSKNLREELKPHGIKVTSVLPGAVLTDTWGDFDNSSKRIMEASDVATLILSASKLSIQAVVEDIILRPQLGDL